MAECPRCKEEIGMLDYFSKVEVSQDFGIDNGGNPEYGSMDNFGDHSNEEYSCPECGAVLAKNEEDAIKVLR